MLRGDREEPYILCLYQMDFIYCSGSYCSFRWIMVGTTKYEATVIHLAIACPVYYPGCSMGLGLTALPEPRLYA